MSEVILRQYLSEIEGYYKAGKATEHTYRGTLRDLLKTLDKTITATNEPKRVKCGAPDYVVERNGFTIGYIEAKDVGISLDKVEKDEQLGRYRRALDNLVLTDYVEFRWYVQGEKRMVARLATPRTDKRLILDKQKVIEVQQLLQSFLEHSAEPIRKPQELAKRMARLTHMIRDVIVNAFREKEASDTLRDLYQAFQETLLPELNEIEFADMFAQTLAYGLFAARYNHKEEKPFSRNDAAKEIPRTNPFLRKLFGSIAGPDLDDEPFVGFVDELAQVLAHTDMDTVMSEFGKKTRQDPIVHFYETFLAQYDPKLRELRGVYYTPEPVISYIVRSVDALLRTYFGCSDGLADTSTVTHTFIDEEGKEHTEQTPRVLILDPATGTATFLYYVIAHIRESYHQMGNAGMWSSYVREHLLPRLFGFELLMAPYAMAHLKLGMQLAAVDLPKEERAKWAYDFQSDERLGIYLTNTLDEAVKRSQVMFGRYISDEANEAAKVKQGYPVMVVLGNPPYSGHSANKGQWINDLLHGKDSQTGKSLGNYFEVDGKPLGERNPKYLYDDYVKFVRFAQWRIEQTGYGILAFITNHGYLENPTFRGMRQSLLSCFDDIYILDLHGDSKKKERSPDNSKDENVFDIQQGVAIGIFVRRRTRAGALHNAIVRHSHLWGPRETYEKVGQDRKLVGGKYYWLAENDITSTVWEIISPQYPFYLYVPQNAKLQEEYQQAWKATNVLQISSNGIKTHRDHFAINFDISELHKRIEDFRNLAISNDKIVELYELQDTRDWKLAAKRLSLAANSQWEAAFTSILYRPFDVRAYYHHEDVVELPRNEVMRHMVEGKNLALLINRQVRLDHVTHFFVTKLPTDFHVLETAHASVSLLPLYLHRKTHETNTLFDADIPPNTQSSRRSNFAPEFTKDFSVKLKLYFVEEGKGDLQQTFGPEDIFSYMYAIFHSPTYRERYAEFLKIDFPHLPLTSNTNLFRELCKLGERLVRLHLMEQLGKIATRFPEGGSNTIEKVNYTDDPKEPEKGRVWINKTQYFEGVLPEVWKFHIGGYQVCEKWLKDRKGRQLLFSDIQHYQRIIAALGETITLMEQIDEAIEEHGGWPIR